MRQGIVAFVVCLFVLLIGCNRAGEPPVERLAILRFENLSDDPSLEWMGRGFSEVLTGSLQGSPARYVMGWHTLHALDAWLGIRRPSPGISAEATDALMGGANRVVYGYFSVVNQTLRATAVEEDLTTHKMVRSVSAAGPLRDGIFPVAAILANRFGDAHSYGTRNAEALREYVEASEAPDPGAASQHLSAAAAADPGFGRAYVLGLDLAMARRDRAGAGRVLEVARTHQAQFTALDRAALDLAAATLRGDFSAQVAALRAAAQADPANPSHHRTLAEALMRTRAYAGAIVEFRRALAIRPDDVVALNSMGYCAAFSGDLPTAIRVLRAYEQLRPNESNPLDSLGDAHYALGHFAEAEQFYLAAHAKAPAALNSGELLKAAQARLMTGDVSGADALFHRYLSGREAAHDPHAPLHAAAWSWQTGARHAALASIANLTGVDADLQAALWLIEAGDRPAAAEHAHKALAEATPQDRAAAALVAFLAQPAEFPAPQGAPLTDYAHAYAWLLARQFQPAVPVLRELYERPTNDPDDGLAVLLAWAYIETGDFDRAEALLRLTPLPQASGLPLFSSLYFPRLLSLRGRVLEHEGHRDQAGGYLQLFAKLSGQN
ncbi:MAG TPA: tetratricopeptide repeat protein [Bryobacteraceae bacterium]|nr:tetratricopeptide repeat protein [Bryobacteraceae bacterium]